MNDYKGIYTADKEKGKKVICHSSGSPKALLEAKKKRLTQKSKGNR